MTSLERVLSLLHEPKQSASGWSARCPAHDDRSPSLSVAESDDGTVVMKCHAGCSTADVLASIGLEMRDLFPDRNAPRPTLNGKPTAVMKAPKHGRTFPTAESAIASLERQHGAHSAMWTYHDAQGEPVGVVVRWDRGNGKKDIRPVSKHPDGWRLAGMPEPRPLFHLPELFSVPRVFILEGEKCANLARGLGLVATTSPHGSASAKQADWRPLAGKDVVIVPDSDGPGRKYAETVADILTKLSPPAKVRVVELPGLGDGDDLEQWLAQRPEATVEELRAEIERLADSVRPFAPATTATSSPSGDDPPIPERMVMNSDAFHGIAGEFIRAIAPHTEADPAALLVQFLVMFGNAAGRSRWLTIDGSAHHPRLFCVVVGRSSTARKGTSLVHVENVMRLADAEWFEKRHISGGLSSGEGLINSVADTTTDDKRLCVVEGEFGSVLDVMARSGNTLSAVIRNAWDGRTLQTVTKASPTISTHPHISIIAHITEAELRLKLNASDHHNGFANRFLWVYASRSKSLPLGGERPAYEPLAALVRERLEFARENGAVKISPGSVEMWIAAYETLNDGHNDSRVAAVTDRGPAQVMRLAMIYALLDGSDVIEADHLKAALAVWQYCERTAARIFGQSAEVEPPIQRRIREMLAAAGDKGMTRTEISAAFHRNKDGKLIAQALGILRDINQARSETIPTNGRPIERWYICPNEETKLTKETNKGHPSPIIGPVSSSNSSISFLRSETGDEWEEGVI